MIVHEANTQRLFLICQKKKIVEVLWIPRPLLLRRLRHALLPHDDPARLPAQVQCLREGPAQRVLDCQLHTRAHPAIHHNHCPAVLEPCRWHVALRSTWTQEL